MLNFNYPVPGTYVVCKGFVLDDIEIITKHIAYKAYTIYKAIKQ